ncbi:MAG: CRISPR-associated endonuclease Cas1 [Methanosarcinales archaeon]
MSIVIDEPGAFIGKRGRSLYIKTPGNQTTRRAMYNLSEVIVTTNCSISSQAIELLAQNGVPLLLIKRGQPYAILHPFFNHGTVYTRREQLAAYWDHRGVHLATMFVQGSMRNRRALLEYYLRNRGEDHKIASRLEESIKRIRKLEGTLSSWDHEAGATVDSIRTELMAIEAQAAKAYFRGLGLIVPPRFNFEGREKRPPKDPVNSLLSYGYTILYSRVLTAIAACGLEPFAGFLHADRSGKPSLVLDMVEEFRQIGADRVVVRMIVRNQLTPDDFEIEGSRLLIKDEARRAFLSELISGLNGEVRYVGNRTVSLVQVMMGQARLLVRYLLGKESAYRPYALRW